MVFSKNYNNFDIYEINKKNARAYFIPAPDYKSAKALPLFESRYKSGRVSMLSGKWDFAYYESVYFLSAENPCKLIGARAEQVPSCWQFSGTESPAYVNTRYPFPCVPPRVPDNTPVGVYQKKFVCRKEFPGSVICFLGVSSAFDLYINDKFAGYSEGSHNTAEFEIADKLNDGENTVTVFVYKWCNGSYLECQDMFRHNGIFRDVFIVNRKENYLEDLKIETDNGGGVRLEASGALEGCTLGIKIRDKSKLIFDKEFKSADLNFALDNIKLWSAEEPNTYTLFLSVIKDGKESECSRFLFGFKSVDVSTKVFKINLAPVKFKGVNHHDTNPEKGFCMDARDYLKDVKLMKEYNVNAVRTSHYPPDPEFLNMCSYYGLYVVDEADIECHGTCENALGRDYLPETPEWEERFTDRVKRLYGRDKNQVCVVMWSLGNEAGQGVNFDACYEFLKSTGSSIPVHYEGAACSHKRGYDVVSVMYPSHAEVTKMGAASREDDKLFDKPYFLCEYAHAMGAGPGGLEDYWKLFYEYERLCGGCIWEWADHAIYHKKGKAKYTYGGQHGELIHDGNFCMDGLFFPDRTPHTGALNMRSVYRPLRISHKSGGRFEIFNTNSFLSADAYGIEWKQLNDGKEVKSGKISLKTPPLKKAEFELPLYNFSKNTHVNFYYYKDGKEIACEQAELSACYLPEASPSGGCPEVKGTAADFLISTKDAQIVFSKRCGTVSSYIYKGVQLINQNPVNRACGTYAAPVKGFFNGIYRAPADNDRNIRHKWEEKNYHIEWLDVIDIKFEKNGDCLKADVDLNLSPPVSDLQFKVNNTYTFYGDGSFDITSRLSPAGKNLSPIPRFGMTLEMPHEFKNIEYFGRGQYENYPDFHSHAPVGIYKTDIDGMFENYLKPQENGCRGNVRSFCAVNAQGKGIKVEAVGVPLYFNISHCLPEHLTAAQNPEFIVKQKTAAVRIDGFMRGLGSNSCGPNPTEEYVLEADKEYVYSFRVTPKG